MAAAASASVAASAAAREQAGCRLWDMSADEGHASAMCVAGLAAVSCKVLSDCADAKARAVAGARATARALATETPSGGKRARDVAAVEHPEPAGSDPAVIAAAAAAAVETVKDAKSARGEPLGGQSLERLREVACGLLANVCSHRGLR